MKKPPSDYTAGERKFADLVAALKAGKPNAAIYRKNSAVTLAFLSHLCGGEADCYASHS